MERVAILVFLVAQTASFRPAVDNEAQSATPDALNASDASDCDVETLEIFDPETLREGIFRPLCGRKTPLEVAVQRGWSDSVEALFQAPELANGMAALRLRLQVLARHLPHWPKDSKDKDKVSERHGQRKVATPVNPDGLDVLRRVVPPELRPTDQEIIGDLPYNWLTFYQIKVMCLNAQNKNSTSQRAMEVILASQGFDSFARNFSLNVILLSLIFFSFGLMVYVSFRLRAFGWLEVPVSLAELVPGAFPPERLADAEFDPSRQKKQLPYRRIPANFSRNRLGFGEVISNGFQAIFGIYTSWLLLCIRIPPEKDAFDEEYMTDDDEECRLKVRDVCAMRAKNVGSIEVIVRALSLCGLHYYLICAGRYSDLFFLDFLYITYAWLVCTVASSVPETVEVDAEATDFPSDDPATTVTAVFGVQHGPRWLRAQCTTRSTAAPNKVKRRLRRRRDQSSGNEGRKGKGRTEKDKEDTKDTKDDTKDTKDHKDDKDDKGDEKEEETEEKEEREERDQEKKEEVKEDTLSKAAEVVEASEKMADGPIFQGPEKDESRENLEIHSSSFSDRFQRLLLNAGIMHINHSSLLELTVVSMCSCFLAVVFLLHLRWTATGSLTNRFYDTEALKLIQTYGLPESFDRALALAAEMLVMWLSFERLYDMCTLLHAATLTFKQRNAALRFLREHQPPWTFAGRDAVTLQQAKDYCEEVVRCSDFALELSDARWRMLQKPVEFVVSLVEVLLMAAFLLILVPMLLPFLPNFQIPGRWHGSIANFGFWAFLDPVVPLTLALVLVSPTVHMLLQAHFANSEIQRQQSILRSRAEFALSRSPLKQEEDVEYVQLRNSSRKAFAKALLKWSHDRVLAVVEPIMVLYSALLVVGLAAISRLNFIII